MRITIPRPPIVLDFSDDDAAIIRDCCRLYGEKYAKGEWLAATKLLADNLTSDVTLSRHEFAVAREALSLCQYEKNNPHEAHIKRLYRLFFYEGDEAAIRDVELNEEDEYLGD